MGADTEQHRNKRPTTLSRTLQVQTGANMVRQEGLASLWSGLSPSLVRSFLYGGARLGLYTPVKSLMGGDGKAPSVLLNVAAGCTSG